MPPKKVKPGSVSSPKEKGHGVKSLKETAKKPTNQPPSRKGPARKQLNASPSSKRRKSLTPKLSPTNPALSGDTDESYEKNSVPSSKRTRSTTKEEILSNKNTLAILENNESTNAGGEQQDSKISDDSKLEYVYNLDDVNDGIKGDETEDLDEHHSLTAQKTSVRGEILPKPIPIESYESVVETFGEIPFTDPRKSSPQAIQFERITTRGRKPQSAIAEELLDEDQIRETIHRKLTYRDLSMLPATAVLPHVVLINMGAVAFFTDLDSRLEIAIDANEKRLNRALNNPTSPLYKQASFDCSLRNSLYDMAILSHPSAYFVCVVPSHQFSYSTKSGHSVIGKGRSFFRMIKKRCIEIITVNLGEGNDFSKEPTIQGIDEKVTVAQACPFVDLPPYYVEKNVPGDQQSTIAVKFDNKSDFEAYVERRMHPKQGTHRDIPKEKHKTSFSQFENVEDAICRLALYYHATLDKRIPITIVSSDENLMTASMNKASPRHPLFNTVRALCPGRLVTNVPPRRREWIDTLSDELQKHCTLKGELTLDDMLCLCESPLLRGDKSDAPQVPPAASATTEQISTAPQQQPAPTQEKRPSPPPPPPPPSVPYASTTKRSNSTDTTNPISELLNQGGEKREVADNELDNPISRLVMGQNFAQY